MAHRRTDRREQPAYTVVEAARYAGVPVSTLTTWLVGRTSTAGRPKVRPLIEPASKKPRLLSFLNLVEVFVLSGIRRHHGVSLQRIRAALKHVEQQMGIQQPLVHAKFETDGLDLFVHEVEGEVLVNVSHSGQLALRDVLASRLHRIEYKGGAAIRLFPLVRLSEIESPRTIVVDPERGFGHPVINGTGIRTRIIVERYRAGESIADLAADYGMKDEHIQDALRCSIPAAA